jgi:ribosomal protein S18 acetylase RimI-like enzyme
MNEIRTGQPQMPISRELNASDWQDYKNLRLLSLQESPNAFEGKYPNEIRYNDAYWIDLIDPVNKEKFFGVWKNGELVSVGCLSLEESGWPAIDRIYTKPYERGRGYSQTIIRMIEQEARKLGIKELFLGVSKSGLDAQAMYKKIGYTKTGRSFYHIEFDKNSGECIEMKKIL